MDKVLLYAPIEKTNDDERMVYGYASTEAVDSQGEIVKKDALKKAISDYMKFANIREMHQPSAVGKTKKAQIDSKGLYIAAKVVDDKAWEKVKEGVYSGFSIGGRVKTMVDNEITDLSLTEISLVDRPANPEAVIDVFKADNFEVVESTEQVEEVKTETVEVETPKEEEKVEVVEEATEVKTETEKVESEETVVKSEEPETKEEVIEEVKVEENPEVKQEPVAEPTKTIQEEVDQLVQEGKMPSDEQITKLLETNEIEVNEQSIGVTRYELAGLVIKAVQDSLSTQAEKDIAVKEAEKIQKSTPVVCGDYQKVLELVEKVETEIQKSTTAEVPTVPNAPVSPSSPAEVTSSDLETIKATVEVLSRFNSGNQLTTAEREVLANGIKVISNLFGGNHVQGNVSPQEATVSLSEEPKDLQKAELMDELQLIKADMEKLWNNTEPIKVRASFVVEKFENPNKETADLESEVEKISNELRNDPNNPELLAKAQTLSLRVMAAKRG